MSEWTNEWTNEWMDEWANEWIDNSMDGRINGTGSKWMNTLTHCQTIAIILKVELVLKLNVKITQTGLTT